MAHCTIPTRRAAAFLTAVALACVVGCGSQANPELLSPQNPMLNGGATEARWAEVVGESPPDCGQQRLWGIEGRHSARDERFLQAALVFNPVYCAGMTEDGLIAAAKASVIAVPELCAAAAALPYGWSFEANRDELPNNLNDEAVKQWVKATGGGPVAEVYGGAEPEEPTAPYNTPLYRYLASERAMMAAVEEYCPQ